MDVPTRTINLLARQKTQSSLDAFIEKNAFWSALGTSLGGSALIACLFCFARPYNSVVYAPRSRHADVKHAPPPVGKGVLDWLSPVIKTKEQELVEKVGLDATIFLRFANMCRNIFTCITIVGLAILVPINIYEHRSSISSTGAKNFFIQLTSQGVQGRYLWGYVLLAWFANLTIAFFLWRNYKSVARLRRAYFESPDYQKSLHSRTLLVTEIPRGLRTDEGLVKIVTEAKDTGSNPRTAIARNVKDLPDLIEEHNETVRNLEQVLAKYLSNPNKLPVKRPTCSVNKSDQTYRKGQKVDAIEYLTARIRELELQIKEVRESIDKRNAMSYGFASYESIADAHTVAYKTRKKGPQKTSIRLAPRPHDIIWKNLPKTSKQRSWQTFINNIWVAVLTVVWIAPNALIAVFLSNLSNLALVWPAFATQLAKNPTTWAVVQGVAAPALTSLFYYFLPAVFRRLSNSAGDLSKTSRERHVMHKLYTFFVFNNLFLFSLFAAIWGYIAAVISSSQKEDAWSAIKDGQLLQKGIRALNSVSTYWITWLLQRNLGAAVDLSQFVNLAWGSFSRHFLNPTPREMIELSAPPKFDYAGYYNYFLFYSTVALCFAYIQPLVLPVTAFYFWVDSYLKKYLLLYVFITKTESGGQFWKVLFNRYIFLTILSDVLVALVCVGNTTFGYTEWLPKVCTLAPLPIFMLAFKWWCAHHFDDKLTFYTTGVTAADTENPAELKTRRTDRVGVRFGHPVLYKPLITPMVSAKSRHLLPSIYSGRTAEVDVPLAGYSDVYMDAMSHEEPGKVAKGEAPAPFEFVSENQMDFEFYKNRPEFRDEAGGEGELYGRPQDMVRRGSHGTLMTQDGTVMTDYDSRRGSSESSATRNGDEAGTTYPKGYHHAPSALRDQSPASSVRSMDIGNADRSHLLSGAAVVAEPTKVNSLDALRAHLHRAVNIAPNKQVFLTTKGKAVRPQTLLTEPEIYVFDSTSFSPNNTNLSLIPDPAPLKPDTPPDSIANHDQLQSWVDLFHRRLEWARALRAQYVDRIGSTQRHHKEQATIQQSVNVAVMSLQLHIRSTEQKYHHEEDWVENLLKQQEAHVDNWERHLDLLRHIPAMPQFARYIQSQSAISLQDSSHDSQVTLQHFVQLDHVKAAASSATNIMTTFAQRVYSIQQSLQSTAKDSDSLLAAVQTVHTSRLDNTDEPAKLLDEVDIIVNKMSSDLDHVASLPKNAQNAARASKMALLHTRNYLPHLDELCIDLNTLVHQTIQERNNAAQNFLRHMQTLSNIESRLAQVHSSLKTLNMSQSDEQVFDTLNVLSKLPFVYGSLMVEAVRRREWADKMKSDSATLAEEMATYQEEEERRRSKWLKSVDDVVKAEVFEGKPLSVEVNLQADDLEWPIVQRQSLQEYIQILTELALSNEIIQPLSVAIKDLDRPTKKQIKHAKTFKNGSMHEAAFGTTSLMLRGEDEYKVLREANLKLEEELKGQKSRVRRLEDILHRHAHMNRATSGDSFRPSIELVSDMVSPTPPSPRPSEEFVRQTVGSRRPSSSLATEEGKLAKRIVSLEAELHTAKEHSSNLEKDAETRKRKEADGQREIEEAVSTKKDIMQNMEAQQREFADERRVLEQDLGQARHRIEELEDEIDRLLGSRDQEVSGIDARAKSLEAEIEHMRQSAEEAELRHQNDLQEVQSSYKKQHEENQRLKEELQTLQESQEKQEQHDSDHVRALQKTHKHLSPATSPPEKYADLVSALENLAQKSTDHVRELSDAIALARSESESLRSQSKTQRAELKSAKAKQAVNEAELIRLQDDMEAEKAHAESLATCLEDEREQLRKLRSMFADGETGADVLRQRVSEEEGRVIQLSEKLSDAQAHAASLDVEIMRVQKQLNEATSTAASVQEQFRQRGVRAKEIAQRLYAQNTRLLRLLEALGFVVAHKDGNMIIERASKVTASTTFDPTSSLTRAISMSSPPPTRKSSAVSDDTSSLTFLHWTEASDATEEATQFTDYMDHISLFSTDIFSEAISKRLRDFEYTARKWQKEARGYKEKNTRLQAESSAKIAVRDFKEGDLALFLPTKGQRTGAWAAFNINAPHHFLREREGMVLNRREWLVARISKIEERVVDLSKPSASFDGRSIGSTSVDAASLDEMNDNPFDLSDGLTWYLVHASEDKPGAPSTPGLGKSTVASSSVDAKGSIRMKQQSNLSEAAKTLNKSLDSRRSSSNSKKGLTAGFLGESVRRGDSGNSVLDESLRRKASERGLGIDSSAATAATSPQLESTSQQQQQQQHAQVRKDLLWAPLNLPIPTHATTLGDHDLRRPPLSLSEPIEKHTFSSSTSSKSSSFAFANERLALESKSWDVTGEK
ncbi:hypothetical protein E4T39_04449 [Aureobasidium subglaciale]|nr:hypothetical protein E4T39_04449 [Aureobasidium subglaciale]